MAIVLGTSSGFVITSPSADPAGTNTTLDGSSVVTKDTSPAGSNAITEIGWYRGAGTNTANFEVALYSDSAGVANTRLFVDATNSSSVTGWITTAVSWAISPNTAYWLAVQMDAHTGSSSIDSATSGGSGIDVLTSQTTLNNPYGGGAVSDADGIFAIYAKVSIAVALDSNTGVVSIAGFAPTTSISDNKTSNTSTGGITIENFAPIWSSEAAGSSFEGFTDTGIIALLGFIPSIQTPRIVSTSFGESLINGFNPTILISDNKTVNTNVGVILITGNSPTLIIPSSIPVNYGEIIIEGKSPSISIGVTININTGSLSIEGYSPLISNPIGIPTNLGELIISGFEPILTIGFEVFSNTGNVTIDGFSPTAIISISTNIYTSTGSLSINNFSPVIELRELAGTGSGSGRIKYWNGTVFIPLN